MRATTLCLALLGLVAGFARPAAAITPFSAGPTDMENDLDTYTPGQFTNDVLNDPTLDGLPPQGNANWPGGAYLAGGPPEFIPGEDWFDIRNTGVGALEEVPSGHSRNLGGVPVFAPDGSPHYAVLNFEAGDGPFGRTNRQISNPGGVFLGLRTGYYATTDLYVDPSIQYGGPDSVVDFWWTNAVNDIRTGTYMTESGITATVDPGALSWTFASTDGGGFLGTVPVGSWVGLEVEPVHELSDNSIHWQHRLYADGGTHNILIGQFTTLTPAFATGPGDFAFLGGPRYNWFTFPDPDNFDVANGGYLFVDNVGWGQAVPEPSSFVLAGFGALGLAYAARRRRRA